MKKSIGLGLIILVMFLLIAPVAACAPPPKVDKRCEIEECGPVTCYIDVDPVGGHGPYTYFVTDLLPEGSSGITSPDGTVDDLNDQVSWSFFDNGAGAVKHYTVTFTSPDGEQTNLAIANGYSTSWSWTGPAWDDYTYDYQTCTNTPEFPSLALPVAMIFGFVGIVLFIQKNREQ